LVPSPSESESFEVERSAIVLYRGSCDHLSPTHVRHLLQSLTSALDERSRELVEALSLAATELVANAVQAGATSLHVTLLPAPTFLELRVADDADGVPELREPGPSEERGRGLLIIERLSDAWGSTPLASGKTVWARFLTR
jgi:two-component sensor histidine kinase